MARQYNIRWSDKDERELKRVVKNFNAKVRRLEAKEPYLTDKRPEKISYKDIRDNVETRQDLNRKLKEIQRFSRRGVEDIRETGSGVITTEWQFKEATIKQRVVTRRRRERRQNVESWRRQETESLFDKPKVDDVSPRGFDQYIKGLEKEIRTNYDKERKELYRDNYITACRNELGVYAEQIVSYVKKVPIETFIEQSLTNPFLDIDFVYTEEEKKNVSDKILEEWQRVT